MRREQQQTTVPVALGVRSYDIEIGAGQIASGRAARRLLEIANGGRLFLVTHPELRMPYAEPLHRQLQAAGASVGVATQAAGETHKTLRAVERLCETMAAERLDRRSVVVVIGGGVLGDTAGFAAAVYMRGIRFVQIPTTLLAMVDSSVGGKTGVDLPHGKNLVGAFHQPSAVLIDPDTLQTLPPREFRSGMAEIIKYGIIADIRFFERLHDDLNAKRAGHPDALHDMICRSCEIKAEIVAADETEQGRRATLNFGHTVGHAIEQVTRYRKFRHGEAIAIGMTVEAVLAERLGAAEAGSVMPPIVEMFRLAKLPYRFPPGLDVDAVIAATYGDKKNVGGAVTYVLPTRIGDTTIRRGIADEEIRGAIEASR